MPQQSMLLSPMLLYDPCCFVSRTALRPTEVHNGPRCLQVDVVGTLRFDAILLEEPCHLSRACGDQLERYSAERRSDTASGASGD